MQQVTNKGNNEMKREINVSYEYNRRKKENDDEWLNKLKNAVLDLKRLSNKISKIKNKKLTKGK